jgi:hypothetical protein
MSCGPLVRTDPIFFLTIRGTRSGSGVVSMNCCTWSRSVMVGSSH